MDSCLFECGYVCVSEPAIESSPHFENFKHKTSSSFQLLIYSLLFYYSLCFQNAWPQFVRTLQQRTNLSANRILRCVCACGTEGLTYTQNRENIFAETHCYHQVCVEITWGKGVPRMFWYKHWISCSTQSWNVFLLLGSDRGNSLWKDHSRIKHSSVIKGFFTAQLNLFIPLILGDFYYSVS